MRVGWFMFALCVALAQSVTIAEARRVALVIGINDYREIPKLEKAVGDATEMTATLTRLGFEVTRVLDADRRTLNLAISDFTASLTSDDTALVHFSGHGVEIDGENYLLPADVPKPQSGREDAVKYEAIGLQRLIAQLAQSGARTRLFIVDACRDNPFEQAGVRSVGSSRGLARVEAPAGTFVMYSAGYRQKALDRLGPDDASSTSVYTRVLSAKLLEPGKSVAQVAQEVRGEVQALAKAAGHDQRPAYYDELSSALVLQAAAPKASTPEASTSKASAPQVSDKQIELAYWDTIKNENNAKLFEAYLEQYPNGSFAKLARLKIDALKPSGKAASEGANRSPAPPVDAPGDQGAPSGGSLVADVQSALNRLGCDAGPPDGVWGPRSATALGDFARHGNVDLTSLGPSEEVLRLLSRRSGRICPLRCRAGERAEAGRCVAAAPAPDPGPGSAPAPRQRVFTDPRIDGVPVDICVRRKRRCKGAAAHMWCRSRGFKRAKSWSHVIYPRTRHIAGGFCRPGAFLRCGGYNRIICAG